MGYFLVSKLTLTFKGKELRIFQVEEGEMTIGSDPSCEIFIDSLAISPKHATIFTNEGESVLMDRGTDEGSYINNERIDEQDLQDKDVIRVGKHNMLFSMEDSVENDNDELEEPLITPDFKNKKKRAWLQLLSGSNIGKTVHLKKNLTNIGTPGVQTAAIVFRDKGYFLTHLEGSKSPLVNDNPIGEKAWPLKDGDIIHIGNVVMQLSLR